MGEFAPLCARRYDRQRLALLMLLPENLDQRSGRAGALSGPIDVIEIGHRMREAKRGAQGQHLIGIFALADRIGRCAGVLREPRRRTGIDKPATLSDPELEHRGRADDVGILYTLSPCKACLDSRKLAEMKDQIRTPINQARDVARMPFDITHARDMIGARPLQIIVDRDNFEAERYEPRAKPRADEAGTACDHDHADTGCGNRRAASTHRAENRPWRQGTTDSTFVEADQQ